MNILTWPVRLTMLMYQSLVLAVSQIWSNKLRSILTTIGIVIGVASVTAVIAALTGLKTKVLSNFEALGTNKVFIGPDRPREGRHASMPWPMLRFTPSLFDGMLDHCPSLKAFSRITRLNASVSFGKKTEENVAVWGIEPSWHEIENRAVVMGRPFSLIDNTQARPVCLINPKLKEKLDLNRDPTGQSIIISNRRYRVVGVVEDLQSTMFGDGGSGLEAFVPFKTIYQGPPMYMSLWIMGAARSPELAEEAKGEITFFMRRKRQLQPGDPNTFRVEFIEQYVRQFNQLATAITIAASGIVGISLVVGGVGIMNIMLVSVSERTREIGLRKSVGAKPSAILTQFLVEAVMLCFVGGLIGVGCGQLLTSLIRSIPNAQLDEAFIPAWAVAMSFGFAAAVGLIFGMFPAIKAASLDPIEALRHE